MASSLVLVDAIDASQIVGKPSSMSDDPERRQEQYKRGPDNFGFLRHSRYVDWYSGCMLPSSESLVKRVSSPSRYPDVNSTNCLEDPQ